MRPLLALLLSACGPRVPEGCDLLVVPGEDDQATVQQALLDVAEGETLCFDAGTYTFTDELSLTTPGVTLSGPDAILDFSGQTFGANGLLLAGDDVTVHDLTVRDTPGDGIRGDQVDGITFSGVTVEWSTPASLENGAYGLYPVGCDHVTITDCKVTGARDAGIYVGQSTHILVEGCEAWGNVAGLEIENSTDAVVRDNHLHDNTAGLLIFNLPGLPVSDGKRTEATGNVVENNNTENFAEQGTVVANVPVGCGVLVVASDDNVIHDNDIRDNRSVGFGLISYIELLLGPYDDPDFDIYPQGNEVRDNRFTTNGLDPEPTLLLLTSHERTPEIVWDGCIDPALAPAPAVCLAGNGDATWLNADFCGDWGAPSEDAEAVACAAP